VPAKNMPVVAFLRKKLVLVKNRIGCGDEYAAQQN
jgi:hypothetical protein